LKAALREANTTRVYLDLFSGVGHVSKCWRRLGLAVLTFDLNDGWDLTDPPLLDIIRGWIRSGVVAAVALGPPCSSWSLARRGVPGSPGGPLRTREHIMGLPGLPDTDRQKVRLGNRTMRAAAAIMQAARAAGVPASLENPASSRMFHSPPLARLGRSPEAQIATADFCQYGARWRKRTKILAVNVGDVSRLERRCSGRHGICSRTKKAHLILEGSCTDGRPWTLVAQPYPQPYATALATVLHSAVNNSHLRRLCILSGVI
jgi:hypothetical protein